LGGDAAQSGGARNSKRPARFRARVSMRRARIATKMGDWNWKPQPAAVPRARKVRRMVARVSIAAKTPKV